VILYQGLVVIYTVHFGLQPPAEKCAKRRNACARNPLPAGERFEFIVHAHQPNMIAPRVVTDAVALKIKHDFAAKEKARKAIKPDKQPTPKAEKAA